MGRPLHLTTERKMKTQTELQRQGVELLCALDAHQLLQKAVRLTLPGYLSHSVLRKSVLCSLP